MTAYRLTDQQLARALGPPPERVAPAGLLDDVRAAISAEPQRRRVRLPWAAPLPDPAFGGRPLPLAIRLAVAVALLAAALWVALIVASQQLPTGQLAGRIIFVSANLDLLAVDPDGGRPIVIEEVDVGGPPVWSRDGHRFAIASIVAGGFGIDIRDSDGALVKRLTAPPRSGSLDALTWSPDRTSLVAVFADGAFGQLYRYEANGEQTDPVNITPPDMHADGPAFAPDGRSLAFIGRERSGDANGLWLLSLDDGSARLVTTGADGFPPAPKSPWVNLSWSPTGSHIAYEARAPLSQTAIFTVAVDGSQVRRLAPELQRIANPAWSPSGELVSFDAAGTGVDGRTAVWTVPAEGSGAQRAHPDASLRGWTPDGRIIAVAPGCLWGLGLDCRQSLVIFPATGVATADDPGVDVVIDSDTLESLHEGGLVPGISDGSWAMDPRLWDR